MAYVLATITDNVREDDGSYRLGVKFTGPDVPDLVRYTRITPATTEQSLNRWALEQVSGTTSERTVATSAALQVGQTLSLTPVPPTPTEALVTDLRQALRRHRGAQKAVEEGALAADDNQVVSRKATFVAAFDALRTATNLNTALDVL